MHLFESLFKGFIDIVLLIVNSSGYLSLLVLSAFLTALIFVLIYAFIRGLSDV